VLAQMHLTVTLHVQCRSSYL